MPNAYNPLTSFEKWPIPLVSDFIISENIDTLYALGISYPILRTQIDTNLILDMRKD